MSELSILLFTIAIVTCFVSLISIRGNKSPLAYSFSLFALCTGLWAFSIGFFPLAQTEFQSILIAKSFYVIAAGIPLFFLIFSIYYSKLSKKPSLIIVPYSVFYVILSSFILFAPNFVLTGIKLVDGEKVGILNLPSYAIYSSYFLAVIITAYSYLIGAYVKSKKMIENIAESKQYKIVIIGTLISFLCGMWFNLILPIYTYQYIWAGPIFSLLLVFTIGYAIRKYNFLNSKVFTVEILISTIWIFILFRTLIANDVREKASNLGLLTLTIIVGIFLIRNVKKEIAAKEHIEHLALDLSNANERLKELDSQKNEFVSLASHQLRGPLTAVKGYGSMLLEGDFGELSPTVKEAIEKIYKSTQDLVIVVGDYLDVSRIEQGRMQYDFSTFDLKELVESVANELKPNVANAHLTLDFDVTPNPNGKPYMINGDKGKIKQVLSNIIDNSIKYTPSGGLHIWLAPKEGNKVLITISDTGVGIHPEVLPKLFAKFTRAPDASKTNILGTGLGLYVAKKMIEAHNGKIWAESAGTGKGSSFLVELDLVEPTKEPQATTF